MRIPGNIPPATRRLLVELNSYQEQQENVDGFQLANGAVPSVNEPFPEYTLRWGAIDDATDDGAHAWTEVERDDTVAGVAAPKPNGIVGDLPDTSKDSNDPENLAKNTAWDLAGKAWPSGTVVLLMMVIPGEWWIVWGSEPKGYGSHPRTLKDVDIVCDDETGTATLVKTYE